MPTEQAAMDSFTARDIKKLAIAFSLYLTSLVASNTLGLKIMPFLFGLHISVGVLCFPFVFLTTDVIGEVYGRKIAKYFVLAGFISVVLFIVSSIIAMAAPWASEGAWVKGAYNQVFEISLRISIASVVAFIVGEYQDVIMFFFVRDRLGSSKFWLRSTLSNIWSQLLDSVLFMVIAFYGIYSDHELVILILTWWLFKVLAGLFYTPLSYLGIRLLRT